MGDPWGSWVGFERHRCLCGLVFVLVVFVLVVLVRMFAAFGALAM